MKKVILFGSGLISILFSTTINIPSDYNTIQAGINASVDGDTVLVEQGTYSENLILANEIVLASHAIYDDLDSEWIDNDNINNTIISGAHSGSCLIVRDGNIQPTIIGFTFQDGVGTSMIEVDCGTFPIRSGGALLLYKAYPTIMYNRFINNGFTPGLAGDGTSVTNGGAISHFSDDDIEFDEDRDQASQNNHSSRDIPEELNIQNNYFEGNSSGNGENVYSHGYEGDIDVSGSVFEDMDCETNTVNEFVLQSIENAADYVQNDISGVCIESNSFYVSIIGDDNNVGTESEPLKTIGHALTLVKDAEIPTTINLSSGFYSPSATGEHFPIVLPDNVHLIGDDSENTILDAEADAENEAAVMIIKVVENVRVANLTLTGGSSEGYGCTGGGGIQVSYDGVPSDVTGDTSGWRALTYPVIENVILEENHAWNGGGMSFYRVEGPVLNNVTIRNNTAAYRGGGIFAIGSTMTMTGVTITGNECFELNGGGMMLAATDGVYDNMTITNNSCGTHGGGIWTNYSGGPESYDDGWTLINSTISGNTSARHGGGIAFAWSHPTVINCTISDNTANWGGGGIMGITSGFTLKESIVSNNYATSNGGGIRASGPVYDGLEPPIIEDCIVTGNETAEESGGILLYNGQVKRTVVFDNHAATYTGGVGIQAFATLTNVTISGNTAPQGGGIEAWNNGHPEVINSIIWNNTPTAVSLFGSGGIDITYSDIEDGWDGEGNIDANPIFVDADNGDYTLQSPDSPCINAGTADLNGDGTEDITDYSGSAPDMGAFESTLPAPTGFQYVLQSESVMLWWDPSTDENFQYFLLERSTDSLFIENVVSNYLVSSFYTDENLEFNTEYFYRVSYFSTEWSDYSETIAIVLEGLDISDGDNLPISYKIHQNHPNPFNPVTTIRYDLPEDGLVNITIYDMMGRQINTLVNGQQAAGYNIVQWNATNTFGEAVSAGLYLYTIHAGDFTQTRKMVLLK